LKISDPSRRIAERRRAFGGTSSELGACVVHPLLEFRRDVGREEAVEKIAAVECQRLLMATVVATLSKHHCVTRHRVPVHTDFFLATRRDCAVAECAAK